MAKSCTTCAFMRSEKDPQIVGRVNMFCHRGPPTPLVVPTGPNQVSVVSFFPPLPPGKDCGEYKLVGETDGKTFPLFGPKGVS